CHAPPGGTTTRGTWHFVDEMEPDSRRRRSLATFLDPRGLPLQIAQEIELGAPHPTTPDHRDALDDGRVQREDPLHADPVGNLADREGSADALAVQADDLALEGLDALLVLLADPDVHLD